MTDWRSFYEKIELSEEEIREAIFEGKVKKYFKERSKQYWEELEHGVPELRKSKGGKQRPDVVRHVQPDAPEDRQSEGSSGTKTDSEGFKDHAKGTTAIRQASSKVP